MKRDASARMALWCACLVLSSCLSMAKRPILIDDVQDFQVNMTTRAQITSTYGPSQKSSLSGNIVNECYRHGWPVQLLLVRYDENDLLVGKYFNDLTAEQECGDLRPQGQPAVAATAHAPASAGHAGGQAGTKRCTMDIECGVGSQCSAGVCTGGIVKPIWGTCVVGNHGTKVCTNTGAVCSVDSECHQ